MTYLDNLVTLELLPESEGTSWLPRASSKRGSGLAGTKVQVQGGSWSAVQVHVAGHAVLVHLCDWRVCCGSSNAHSVPEKLKASIYYFLL